MRKEVINGLRVVVSAETLQALPIKRREPAKTTKALSKDAQAVADLTKLGGICTYGSWQTGTGNYKKSRAVPVGAAVFSCYDANAPIQVLTWFREHSRARRCVAFT